MPDDSTSTRASADSPYKTYRFMAALNVVGSVVWGMVAAREVLQISEFCAMNFTPPDETRECGVNARGANDYYRQFLDLKRAHSAIIEARDETLRAFAGSPNRAPLVALCFELNAWISDGLLLVGVSPVAVPLRPLQPELVEPADRAKAWRWRCRGFVMSDNLELLDPDHGAAAIEHRYAEQGYHPSDHYTAKYGITNECMRKARNAGRLPFEKRGKRYFMHEDHVRALWPDVFDIARPDETGPRASRNGKAH